MGYIVEEFWQRGNGEMNSTTEQQETSLVNTHYQLANEFYHAGDYHQAYQELKKACQHAQDAEQAAHIEQNMRELQKMMQQEPEPVLQEQAESEPVREPNKMLLLTMLVGLICLTPIVMKCIEIFSQPSVSSEATVATETETTATTEVVNNPEQATPQATPNVIVEADVNGNLIPAGAPQSVITGNSVNLRETPSLQGASLGTLVQNQAVTVLESSTITADGYTWSKVQTAAGASGWIASQFVRSDTPQAATQVANTPPAKPEHAVSPASEPPAATAAGLSRKVSGNGVSLRGEPKTAGVLLTTLSGTAVTVLEDKAVTADGYTWSKIRTQNGTEGWIASQFLAE